MKLHKQLWFLVLPAFSLFAFTVLPGCRTGPYPKPGKYAISITRDAEIETTELQVDVVGLNEQGKRRLDEMQRVKYFEEDAWRKELLDVRGDGRRLYFKAGASTTNTQIIDRKDPLWQRWASNGVSYLVVIDNYPPQVNPGHISAIPFDRSKWKRSQGNLPKMPGSYPRARTLSYTIYPNSIKEPSIVP